MWRDDFSNWLGEDGRSQRTVEAYLQDIHIFEDWYTQQTGQVFQIDKITNWDMKQFRRYSLEEQGVRAATWNRRRASLQQLSEYAQASGLLKINPMRGVLRQEETTVIRWLDNIEYGRVMRAVENQVNLARTDFQRIISIRDRAMIVIMLHCGLRVEELCRLDFEDIWLGERKGSLEIRHGKGDKSRKVPIGLEGREVLKTWLEIRSNRPGALFLDRNNGRIDVRSIQKRVSLFGEIAHIEGGLSPHDFRRSCAKRMRDNGERLETIAAIFGHKSIRTTQRYVKPGWQDLEEAIERL